jgi:hypothetical protein
MSRWASLALVLAGSLILVLAPTAGASAEPGRLAAESDQPLQLSGTVNHAQSGESLNVEARTRVVDADGMPISRGSSGGGEPEEKATDKDRMPFRASQSRCEAVVGIGAVMQFVLDACGELADLECEEGQRPIGSAFEYTAVPSSTRPEDVPDPRQTQEAFCAVSQEDLADAARKAFEQMTITPSPVRVQPDAQWTVINIHNPVHTSDEPQEREVTLLGIDVQVRAVPTEFAWSFGDGTPALVTREPGREWTRADGDPDPGSWIGHTYDVPGVYEIGLTTTWRGQFRITGAPSWTDIPGQATTTSPGPTWEALEMRSVLVDNPTG